MLRVVAVISILKVWYVAKLQPEKYLVRMEQVFSINVNLDYKATMTVVKAV
jgi:hypothetical protein